MEQFLTLIHPICFVFRCIALTAPKRMVIYTLLGSYTHLLNSECTYRRRKHLTPFEMIHTCQDNTISHYQEILVTEVQ